MESKSMGLPAAWQERIEVDAKARWPLHVNEPENEKLRTAYEVGAMVYAPWLYTCQTNYAALQAKCERYEKALKKINGMSQVVGQPGCTWCDTDLDSMAVAAGYNQALDNILPIANEALSGGEGDNFTEAEAEFMKECNMHLLTDGGAIIQTENDEGARLTKDDLLRLSSILYRYANQKENKQ